MRILIILVILAGGAWFAKDHFMPSNTKGKQEATALVSVAASSRIEMPQTINLIGNIIAYETVAVKSRLDSQVIDVLFTDGAKVTAGQPLFKLDERALNAQMRELEANVAKEKAQAANARLQFERAQKLIATKAVSQSHVDDARAAFEAQNAIVAATQASMENVRVLLSYTSITAPISGRAGTIFVTRGNNVKANDTQALVTINQVQPIRAQFAIPERYYEAVRTAQAAGKAILRAGRKNVGVVAEGKLEYIDNTIDPATGTFTARARFENADEALWPGMFVELSLELPKELALTIPSEALQGDENAHYVFVATDGKAVKTPVKVARVESGKAIILEGIGEGVQVITDGLLKVNDGGSIQVSNP